MPASFAISSILRVTLRANKPPTFEILLVPGEEGRCDRDSPTLPFDIVGGGEERRATKWLRRAHPSL